MRQAIPSQRILVVDDEPMVRDAIRMLLTIDGHQVEAVSSGAEALEKLAIRTFDVVFTDLRMPGMADESARAIKRMYPHQVIVMVTAHANVLSPRHKEDVLVDFMISKPFDLGTLRSSLKRAHELKQENSKRVGSLLARPSTPP